MQPSGEASGAQTGPSRKKRRRSRYAFVVCPSPGDSIGMKSEARRFSCARHVRGWLIPAPRAKGATGGYTEKINSSYRMPFDATMSISIFSAASIPTRQSVWRRSSSSSCL